MNRTRWIFAALLVAFAAAMVYVGSDPEMSKRYNQAVIDAQLATQTKDLVMGGLVVVICGYLGWYLFRRKE